MKPDNPDNPALHAQDQDPESRPTDHSSESYVVGYRKPPTGTRFKPGASGNPRGRPKRSRNMRTLLLKELTRTVEMTENGKTRRITKAEAAVKRLLLNAMKGDGKALLALFSLTADDPEITAEQIPEIRDMERDLLASFAQRYADEQPEPSIPNNTTENGEGRKEE